MNRQTITAAVVAASLAGGLGYGLGTAASPEPADAAGSNADVVRQLKKMDAHLVANTTQVSGINQKLGTQAEKGTVRWLLTTICNYTASIDCG